MSDFALSNSTCDLTIRPTAAGAKAAAEREERTRIALIMSTSNPLAVVLARLVLESFETLAAVPRGGLAGAVPRVQAWRVVAGHDPRRDVAVQAMQSGAVALLEMSAICVNYPGLQSRASSAAVSTIAPVVALAVVK